MLFEHLSRYVHFKHKAAMAFGRAGHCCVMTFACGSQCTLARRTRARDVRRASDCGVCREVVAQVGSHEKETTRTRSHCAC